MLLGGGMAAATAAILSVPLFRMKGFYFLIGSFAAGEIIRLIWKRFTDPFGGPKGLKRIDPFPDIEFGFLSIDFYEPVNYYFLALVVVSTSLFVLYRIERSRIGLTFHAIHWQDRLAESVGVDTFRYRTLAFVIASFFAGIAGGLYAHYIGAVNPTRFSVDQMVYVLVWAVVGGTATFHGPILGVVVLTVINEIVLRALGLDTARPLIYGAILILSVLYLPNGLESLDLGCGPVEALARRSGRNRKRAGMSVRGERPILEARGLTRQFGGVVAVNNFSFSVREA